MGCQKIYQQQIIKCVVVLLFFKDFLKFQKQWSGNCSYVILPVYLAANTKFLQEIQT